MKQTFRQSMAWLHSWSGLVLGWLLFAIVATGAASIFKSEISSWMRPELRIEADPVRAVAAAIDYLRVSAPDAPAWYLTPPDERRAATQAFFSTKDMNGENQRHQLALDPLTGKPDGIRKTLGGEFFYRFHFELQLPYPWGRILASAAAMMMLVALISGIITHRRIFADFFTLRPGKGKRSWLDAHNVLGVLALPFHLMITFTGMLTLVTLTLPWGVAANYGADMTTAYAEIAPGDYECPRTDRPAPLGDIGAMLADAQKRFGGGRIGRVNIANPGDAAAVMMVGRHDGDQLAYAPSVLAYDGVSGKLLSSYVEQRPVKKTFDVLYGLHMGRFAPHVSRWLYFVCSLALAGTIATGLVLWTASRAGGRTFGHQLVERLTVGSVGGLPLAMAAYFWANRLLSPELESRSNAEVRCFFIVWLTVTLLGLVRVPKRGWVEVMGATAAAWLLLPAVSAMTVGRSLPQSIWRGDWLFAGFDLVSLALGSIAAAIAVKLARRQPATVRQRRVTA